MRGLISFAFRCNCGDNYGGTEPISGIVLDDQDRTHAPLLTPYYRIQIRHIDVAPSDFQWLQLAASSLYLCNAWKRVYLPASRQLLSLICFVFHLSPDTPNTREIISRPVSCRSMGSSPLPGRFSSCEPPCYRRKYHYPSLRIVANRRYPGLQLMWIARPSGVSWRMAAVALTQLESN